MKKLVVIMIAILCQSSVYQVVAQDQQVLLDESKVISFDKKIWKRPLR